MLHNSNLRCQMQDGIPLINVLVPSNLRECRRKSFTIIEIDHLTSLLWAPISDQALVICHLPIEIDSAPLTERLVRGWRQVTPCAGRESTAYDRSCRC